MRQRQGRTPGEHPGHRRARRAAAASARRLHRLERARRRGPAAAGVASLAVVAAVVVLAIGAAAMAGRVDVPPPPGVTIDLARSADPAAGQGDLVVRIVNGSGDEAMTAEVARLARTAGIHGYTAVEDAVSATATRVLVHRDVPDVVAAAADLADLVGAGVVERADARDHDADLTVVLGTDVRDPA